MKIYLTQVIFNPRFVPGELVHTVAVDVSAQDALHSAQQAIDYLDEQDWIWRVSSVQILQQPLGFLGWHNSVIEVFLSLDENARE